MSTQIAEVTTDRYLSIADVAERLQVNQISIRRAIWQRRLAAVKCGSLWRVPEAAVEAFLEAETARGAKWPYVA